MSILGDRKKFRLILAVFGLLIFLNIIGFSGWGRRLFSSIINPSARILRENSQGLTNEKKTRASLSEKISLLEEEKQLNEVDLAKLYSLEEENAQLREYLKFFNERSFRYVLANVVWQENLLNFSHYNQNIVINKGSRDGLREGLAIVSETGVIIGKIIEVEDRSSRVCLINNNFCKMAVSLSNSTQSIGLAEGDLGLSIKVNFVSQNEVVNVGDRIITSGLERDIPRGLAVGKINYVDQEVNDVWQNINAEALFSINNLSIVAVIIPE